MEGIFPNAWKNASITPIHKSGNIHQAENYRGISILSCFPKVFESLVFDVLYQSVRHTISEDQHGFMKGRSTTTNLMTYVSKLVPRLDKRQQVDAVYVDLSKAFDKVPHELAIEKMRRTGLPDWLWSKEYNDASSDMLCVNYHGSTLITSRLMNNANNVDCSELLSLLPLNAPIRTTRTRDFLRLALRRTQYGQNNPLDQRDCLNAATIELTSSGDIFLVRTYPFVWLQVEKQPAARRKPNSKQFWQFLLKVWLDRLMEALR
ncbi:uncharacterized protein LOC129753049 [Uranotaenia lowii]|uniref:uncharacterized protein LOC129753049 n=1 Tax=Uranotaenia lowii TaxID=190385 RepID=UPI002479918B|nr:uncharacterized protein LOC129753049 [Uranotaenia lowii]